MRSQKIMIVGLVLGLTVALGGCASTSDSSSESTSASSSEAKPAEAPKKLDIPAKSALAKIELGMNDSQVRKLIGEPANIRSYPTGKNWIPFYFGGDTYRFDWSYSNTGKVVFGNTSRFSRSIQVVDVIHNPDEP